MAPPRCSSSWRQTSLLLPLQLPTFKLEAASGPAIGKQTGPSNTEPVQRNPNNRAQKPPTRLNYKIAPLKCELASTVTVFHAITSRAENYIIRLKPITSEHAMHANRESLIKPAVKERSGLWPAMPWSVIPQAIHCYRLASCVHQNSCSLETTSTNAQKTTLSP